MGIEMDTQRLAGHIAAIRAYTAYTRGEHQRAKAFAEHAQENLPEADKSERSFAAAMLATSLRMSGDLPAAEQAYLDAIQMSQAAGNAHAAMTAVCDLAGLQGMQGKLHQSMETCRQALKLADEHYTRSGWQLPALGHAYGRMSQVFYEWNDLEAAIQYAKMGIEICQQGRLVEFLADNYVYRATALQAMGDPDGALQAFEQAKNIARELSSWYTFIMDAWEVWFMLAQGRVDAIAGWIEDILTTVKKPGYQYGFKNETLVRGLIAQERWQQALEALSQPLMDAQQTGATTYEIKLTLLKALILQAQGEPEGSQDLFDHALMLAAPEGFVRSFLDEGPMVGKLLRQAAIRGVQGDYPGVLLGALEVEMAPEAQLSPLDSSSLIEPLSQREIQVLRLLNTHLTSTEIAEELVISVNTVRSHMKNIYSKLNVHSRSQAINQAKEHNLL
jgi:LuxR family maltose regulon positive regulatory protein